jgi:hypothetical protein
VKRLKRRRKLLERSQLALHKAEAPEGGATEGPREPSRRRTGQPEKPADWSDPTRCFRVTAPTGPLGTEWVWQNHVQQDYGKNPNGTGNDMVRDKVRDKVGRVPWNAQFRRWKTRCFAITARQDHWAQNGCGRIMYSRTMGRIRMGPGTTWCETRWDACPGTRNFGAGRRVASKSPRDRTIGCRMGVAGSCTAGLWEESEWDRERHGARQGGARALERAISSLEDALLRNHRATGPAVPDVRSASAWPSGASCRKCLQ